MVKIRLIFNNKKTCMSTQSTPQISDFQKINKQKISWLCLSLWNKMVHSSLQWPSGSSHTDKRLAWQSQGQLQTRLRFWRKLEMKRNNNALICGAFCDINKSLVTSVWNYTLSIIQDLFSWYCELLLLPKVWKCQFFLLILTVRL